MILVDIKTCEQYVLNELNNTQNELVLVKKELEETNFPYNKTYYILYNNLLGYLIDFNLKPNDSGKFEVEDMEFGDEYKAIIFEIINNNHNDLNDFIYSHNSKCYDDNQKLWKKEIDNVVISSNHLKQIVDLMR